LNEPPLLWVHSVGIERYSSSGCQSCVEACVAGYNIGMGLETVEIVMSLEDYFHIEIPDSAASSCITVSDLQQVVVDLLANQGRVQGEELQNEVWKGMITVLAKEGYPVNRILPESKWIGDITKNG
jgi:hypothetical protein